MDSWSLEVIVTMLKLNPELRAFSIGENLTSCTVFTLEMLTLVLNCPSIQAFSFSGCEHITSISLQNYLCDRSDSQRSSIESITFGNKRDFEFSHMMNVTMAHANLVELWVHGCSPTISHCIGCQDEGYLCMGCLLVVSILKKQRSQLCVRLNTRVSVSEYVSNFRP